MNCCSGVSCPKEIVNGHTADAKGLWAGAVNTVSVGNES